MKAVCLLVFVTAAFCKGCSYFALISLQPFSLPPFTALSVTALTQVVAIDSPEMKKILHQSKKVTSFHPGLILAQKLILQTELLDLHILHLKVNCNNPTVNAQECVGEIIWGLPVHLLHLKKFFLIPMFRLILIYHCSMEYVHFTNQDLLG